MWTSILFAVLATTPATAFVADANVATLKKLCAIAGEMKGKTLSAELMQQLSGAMAEHYAHRISCSASPNSDFGFKLENVPLVDCFAASASKMVGITVEDFPCEGFAPVVGTGGKQVLWGFSGKLQLVSGEALESAIDYKYTFGEDGKIVAFEQNWDTAPMDDANVVTLKKLFAIEGELTGKAISQTWKLYARNGVDMAKLYAQKIDCSSVANNAKYGYALTNVPAAECFAKAAAMWEGYEITTFGRDDVASVSGSKGKKLISSFMAHLVTPGGERASGRFESSYTFNDAGKIVATDLTFDTGIFGEASAHTVSLTAEQPQWQAFPLIVFAMGCIAGPAMVLAAMRVQRQQSPTLLEGYKECDA